MVRVPPPFLWTSPVPEKAPVRVTALGPVSMMSFAPLAPVAEKVKGLARVMGAVIFRPPLLRVMAAALAPVPRLLGEETDTNEPVPPVRVRALPLKLLVPERTRVPLPVLVRAAEVVM